MGVLDWLFGKKSSKAASPPQPPAAPAHQQPVSTLSPAERAEQIQRNADPKAESTIGTTGGITFTASVQVRDMTPAEVAEAHGWYTKAFDWVMQEVAISGAERERLLTFLLERWNDSRLKKSDVDALGIALSWPRAESHLRSQQRMDHKEQVADLDAMGAEEALRCLKAPELKALMQAHGLATKGRTTKATMIAALLELDVGTLRSIRDGLVARFKNELTDPAAVDRHELFEMLHLRIVRARYRMQRAEQLIESLSMKWPDGKPLYTHIRVNVFGHGDEVAACGLKQGAVRPAAALLDRVKQPLCESLDCRCSFSPHSPERSARRSR